MTKVYSRNEEWFDYEHLQDLINDHELVEGDLIFEGESEPVRPIRLFDADDLIDYLADRMYDEVGECADGWPFVTPNQREGINEELSAFLEKHFPQSFYRVLNVSERKITKEDIE